MSEKQLIKGTEAIAIGALKAGCKYYFGYPITPQNEVPEYLSAHIWEYGGKFLQAESEIASINMLIGAASTGARVMTSSSSPGISLMQEGFSYLAGDELPAVVINMTRTGPGLGGINATQGDYFQAVKGGGHGDYKNIVLAPHSVQELFDLTYKAFNLADKYRMVAVVLADAILGQMKEAISLDPPEPILETDKSWSLTGAKGRDGRIIKSLYLKDGEMEEHIRKLWKKYERLKREDTMYELQEVKDAEILFIAFGSAARIAKTAIKKANQMGKRVSLLRPITLFPFPDNVIRDLTQKIKKVLVFETNMGQMVEDVKLSVSEGVKVKFYGRPGGTIVSPEEILQEIMNF